MSKSQLHKRLTTDQVKIIMQKYVNHELKAKDAMTYLDLSRPRFYEVLQEYRKDPKCFSIDYVREEATRKIHPDIEAHIWKELRTEKEKVIDNPEVPVRRYNDSYIQNLLREKYGDVVSVPTIIGRAKEKGYWKERPPKKIHDREVLTNFSGELVQHDSSHHLFAPDGKMKWYLITSLDDYSRAMLYADFWMKESSWAHISAAQSVILKYGIPLQYYADQHAIFRYVKDRDKETIWNHYSKFTDDVDPQWKQVLKDCGIKPIYALSPQAKGKIERPYEWLQDHVVRTCVRNNVTRIEEGREILKMEIEAYNWKRIHSTTKEVPMRRFEEAKKNQKTLFRPFEVKAPFTSSKDIFCLRLTRVADAYRTISVKNLKLKVSGAMPRNEVELRMYPNLTAGLTEIRFWFKGHFVSSQKVKTDDLGGVSF